jgi:hypothetical protein
METMRPWAAAVLVLALVAPLATGSVCAQALPADADRDGVTDDGDACPDSAPHELVDTAGCAVCDCEVDAAGTEWSTRRAYLGCVLAELRARRTDGSLGRKAARLALKAARNSSCGYATRVRCCIMFPEKAEGMCRIVDELRCDEALLGPAVVEDLDSGSCFPNPCVFE